MNKFGKGMAAGLVATIVLSALMVMKMLMGVMPELDLPKMIAGMMGMPDQPLVGWAIHFMIGVVLYGVAMALLDTRLPDHSSVGHGILIAVAGWALMMVMLMPMAGAGLFGMKMGTIATLVLHLIFGAVLGWVYERSIDKGRSGRLARG